jgi:hypothetical protein
MGSQAAQVFYMKAPEIDAVSAGSAPKWLMAFEKLRSLQCKEK